jgi:transposase
MESGQRDVALREAEVPMVDPEVVRQIHALRSLCWGSKRIAKELGVTRNTVKRYLRGGQAAKTQQRPSARCLDDAGRHRALELFDGVAEGNAVVVRRLLRQEGTESGLRTVQRVVEEQRRSRRAAQAATVRFETAPGHQLQIDFGEKRVRIAGALVRVYLFVAVLAYSRRIYVRAGLSQRQDDWREGLVGAFRQFGGLTQTLLMDNAGALVIGRDAQTQTATLHPTFAQFCRDWGVEARVCRPYRARTKGKTESGVKYVKRNALAGLEFVSFAALEAHLGQWMHDADERIHGTTHEVPRVRFEAAERTALRPLPKQPLPVRERRLQRRVATDCLIDVDTVRYSVPHRLVRETVEVLVGEDTVRIFFGADEVAQHHRSREPHARVVDRAHYHGLWRRTEAAADTATAVETFGRSLADYAAVVEGGAA